VNRQQLIDSFVARTGKYDAAEAMVPLIAEKASASGGDVGEVVTMAARLFDVLRVRTVPEMAQAVEFLIASNRLQQRAFWDIHTMACAAALGLRGIAGVLAFATMCDLADAFVGPDEAPNALCRAFRDTATAVPR
jgi:hypothetical protein